MRSLDELRWTETSRRSQGTSRVIKRSVFVCFELAMDQIHSESMVLCIEQLRKPPGTVYFSLGGLLL